MATKVLLPKFGQTVETSEVTQWLVAEGAAVKKGDILCEIATDKSTLEVESQYEGVLLKIILAAGVTAPVGCVMAVIGAPSEKLDEAFLKECQATLAATASAAPATAVAPPAPKPKPAAAPAPAAKPAASATAVAEPRNGRVFISPRARKAASASEVPIALLSGSGENGRIVEADVRAYVEALPHLSPAARTAAFQQNLDLRSVKGSGPNGQIVISDLANARPAGKPSKELPVLTSRLEKPSPMRRAIAASMALSAQTIPAFQVEVTVDAASLIARREAAKQQGKKISYGDIIAKATANAIRLHPNFAAAWTDQGIQYLDRVDIGFAVAIPGGLVVPVVRHCDSLDIEGISAASIELVEKARAGKLQPEDYTGGCFTLSNLGAFPVDRFVAIVPPGQSGIIAIGRIRDELVVRDGGIFLSKAISLTLSADHRLVDGAEGAAFMRDLKDLLEDASGL